MKARVFLSGVCLLLVSSVSSQNPKLCLLAVFAFRCQCLCRCSVMDLQFLIRTKWVLKMDEWTELIDSCSFQNSYIFGNHDSFFVSVFCFTVLSVCTDMDVCVFFLHKPLICFGVCLLNQILLQTAQILLVFQADSI